MHTHIASGSSVLACSSMAARKRTRQCALTKTVVKQVCECPPEPSVHGPVKDTSDNRAADTKPHALVKARVSSSWKLMDHDDIRKPCTDVEDKRGYVQIMRVSIVLILLRFPVMMVFLRATFHL